MSFNWSTKIGNNDQGPKLADLVHLFDFNKANKKTKKFRPIGQPYAYIEHWIDIKKKDGTKTSVRKLGLRKPDDQTATCPYEAIGSNGRTVVLINAIDREAQEQMPAKMPKALPSEKAVVEKGIMKGYRLKDKNSKTWTPVVVVRLTSSPWSMLAEATAMNVKVDKTTGEEKTYPPSHAKFGFDIGIKYDSGKPPANQYYLAKLDRTPLTEEEQEYLVWKLDIEKPEPYDKAVKNANSLKSRMLKKADVSEEEDDAEDAEDDDTPKKKKKKRPVDDDEDEDSIDLDDSDSDDDDDADEDDTPKKKKKRPADDEDEDDDTPKKKKKKPVEDDDEDDSEEDDSDDNDGEDDDDEPPPKKKKKKPVDEDDEGDSDDSEEDEDEDDVPPKKKKKKPVEDDDEDEDDSPPKKKKKKPVDDDDEEEVPKKKKKKSSEDW